MTINITDKSPKTYIVLGMHQGGTSIISKALNDQGIDMGIGGNNGTYEDNEFVQLNNEILARSGGSWLEPPKKIKPHVGAAKLINKRKKDFWGWKDPRTVLALDAYTPYLKDDVYLVCVFRKPKKVSESLNKRSKHPRNSLELTKEHYRKIIEHIQEFADL